MWGLINWLQEHMIPCASKKFLGIECPGCGLQRSFIALLKGNFIESLKLNAALIPLLLLITTLFVHLVFKLKNGAKIILVLQVASGVIMILQYFIKQFLLLSHLY